MPYPTISIAELKTHLKKTKKNKAAGPDNEVNFLEKCTKNLIGHSRLAFNNHESNIDC